eukprot:CAMPEP_0119499588 /NCGR_PEP_ID=MMETSP1344-20130328/22002_1 /TAXON_ID=236787 /ORGANISM="Florenciella parvula, Strain CCMP2471" /LENGTH=51 /DNA_ID=CAMNT_0007535593 /DNA_START=156 /DNA_END=309 /DNA_ORIENTATION=-
MKPPLALTSIPNATLAATCARALIDLNGDGRPFHTVKRLPGRPAAAVGRVL